MATAQAIAAGQRGSPYALAFLDWLACAHAGAGERAARAVRATGADLLTHVAFAATAGHVLDFDDTFAEGVAHVSATCAPAALVLAADMDLSLATMLQAYAEGFEIMAAVAAASHPTLYERGWHPTAVCGPVGAAVAAARLLGLGPDQRLTAIAISLLRAGGTRGAFGSDAKAIQVGMAAAAGVQAALLARAGARVNASAVCGELGFAGVVGGRLGNTTPAGVPEPDGSRAIERNWTKLYPSCLATHAPIEAALAVREQHQLDGEPVEVRVHPRARQAAHVQAVDDGLSAKFSIPYCVALAFSGGVPGVGDFAGVQVRAVQRAHAVHLVLDPSLPEFGAVMTLAGDEPVCVPAPRGAPERPATESELARKVADLSGDRLNGILANLEAPAARALAAAGLTLI